jgi:hypothetical protein
VLVLVVSEVTVKIVEDVVGGRTEVLVSVVDVSDP